MKAGPPHSRVGYTERCGYDSRPEKQSGAGGAHGPSHLPKQQPMEETPTFSTPQPPLMPLLSESGSPHAVVSDPERQDPAKKGHPAVVQELSFPCQH